MNDRIQKNNETLLEQSLNPFSSIPFRAWLEQFDEEDQDIACLLAEQIQVYTPVRTRTALQELHTKLAKAGITPDNSVFSYLGVAKSGGVISYLYRQANDMPLHSFWYGRTSDTFLDFSQLVSLQNIPDSIENLVLLDDIIGGGQQSIRTLSRIAEPMKVFKRVVLAPVNAYPVGIENITKSWPNTEVITPQEVWPVTHEKYQGLTESEKEKLEVLISKYNKRLFITPKPFTNLPIVFSHNAPGSIVPVLGYDVPGVWSALFSRYKTPSSTKSVGVAKDGFKFATSHIQSATLMSIDLVGALVPDIEDQEEKKKIAQSNVAALNALANERDLYVVLNTSLSAEELYPFLQEFELPVFPVHAVASSGGRELRIKRWGEHDEWLKDLQAKPVDEGWYYLLKDTYGENFEQLNPSDPIKYLVSTEIKAEQIISIGWGLSSLPLLALESIADIPNTALYVGNETFLSEDMKQTIACNAPESLAQAIKTLGKK